MVPTLAELCVVEMVEVGLERFPIWFFAKLPAQLVEMLAVRCQLRGMWSLITLQALGFCNLSKLTLPKAANDIWLSECLRHELKELNVQGSELTWSSHRMFSIE